jgi:predicted DNA-binding transcriptional regulator YafY
MDRLIRSKATGSPDEFAVKLDISKRALFDNLNILKDLGAPIAYSKSRNSYYYNEEGGFQFSFKKNHSKEDEL